MKEFLFSYYSILIISVEALAAVTALLCYKKYKHTVAKFFIYFLIYVFICETIALYTYQVEDGVFSVLKGTLFARNYWWINLTWGVGSTLFYCFFYYKLINASKVKVFIKIILGVFLLFCLSVIALNVNRLFTGLVPSIMVFSELIILFLVSVYFFEMLQSDRILNFYKSIYFYISATMFIWLIIITPIVFYNMYYTKKDMDFVLLQRLISSSANIFMYLTFTFALLWCKPENR
ncbi:hypothetical protein [Formosa sp. A9]|uniref:hypothetical protein n=1 Tax=Formosa sp. A9 TaxID=3442641 RepID=UPI003EBDF19F